MKISRLNHLWGVVAIASSARAVDGLHADTTLTIYSRATPGAVSPDLYRPGVRSGSYFGQSVPGYAIVRDDRKLSLTRGRGLVSITDVAALLDPSTVRLSSLTDPDGTQVGEQDFRFDLVGSQKLMQRYIDQQITVEQREHRWRACTAFGRRGCRHLVRLAEHSVWRGALRTDDSPNVDLGYQFTSRWRARSAHQL